MIDLDGVLVVDLPAPVVIQAVTVLIEHGDGKPPGVLGSGKGVIFPQVSPELFSVQGSEIAIILRLQVTDSDEL